MKLAPFPTTNDGGVIRFDIDRIVAERLVIL